MAPDHTQNSRELIQKLSLAYTATAAMILMQKIFFATILSKGFSEFGDFIFNSEPNDPLSILLSETGAWFFVFLCLAMAVLATVIYIAYWVVGIVLSVLLRKKLQKEGHYEKTGIFFGVWAIVPAVSLIYDLMRLIKDAASKDIFGGLGACEVAISAIGYIALTVSIIIGIAVLLIIYKDRKNIRANAQPRLKGDTDSTDMC